MSKSTCACHVSSAGTRWTSTTRTVANAPRELSGPSWRAISGRDLYGPQHHGVACLANSASRVIWSACGAAGGVSRPRVAPGEGEAAAANAVCCHPRRREANGRRRRRRGQAVCVVAGGPGGRASRKSPDCSAIERGTWSKPQSDSRAGGVSGMTAAHINRADETRGGARRLAGAVKARLSVTRAAAVVMCVWARQRECSSPSPSSSEREFWCATTPEREQPRRHTDMGAKQRQDQGTGRGEREEYRMDKAPVHGMEGEPRMNVMNVEPNGGKPGKKTPRRTKHQW